MSDQPDEGVQDLADAFSEDPIEEIEELEEEDEQVDDEEGQPEEEDEDDESEADEDETEPEEEATSDSEKFKLTVKNERGEDEEKELTLEELAEGYMLSSDYTRKRQAEAETVRQKEVEYQNAFIQTQTQSAEQIEQLKAFVIQNAAPELAELTPQLAATNPSKYVALQAKYESVQQTLSQLDQTKADTMAQSEQVEMQARGQRQEQDRAYIAEHIPEFSDKEYQSKMTDFAHKTYGITQQDLAFLTAAPVFKAGGILDGGKLVHMLNDAMKYRSLETQKPIQMKKVKAAPKIIRPKAPKPKASRNRKAEERLKKYGRVEDLAAFL